MKLGIGIDTGGTYTDAVIYDFNSKKILAAAKALTTKEDLSVGIENAMGGLDSKYFDQVSFVSLSTTLATNACIENKGGRAKLLFLGVEKRVLDWVGEDYGLHAGDEIYCCEHKSRYDGEITDQPDWPLLLEDTRKWLRDADGLGIVELYAMKNGAVFERKAKQIFSDQYAFPIVCGHELFSELNSLQRGASTLLNAKLVPVIQEFLAAIKTVLAKKGITAPVVIVRSDGTLMSEEFSRLRPVETILCGPAASVLGGVQLADEQNSMIIDMGGTTTDISLVKDGAPVRVKDGVSIGKWRTFVKGVFIDTFGLGGDSAVRLGDSGLMVDTRRVTPMCVASKRWPNITGDLRALLESNRVHATLPLHEFFYLVRDIPDPANYSENELAFCAALRERPLLMTEATEATGLDVYTLNTERLEREGIVMRCGLTPTDIMHIKGDFSEYDAQASRLAAQFVIKSLYAHADDTCSMEEFCEMVYDLVKKKLYQNIVRILLQDKFSQIKKDGLSGQLEMLISESWEINKRAHDTGYTDFDFSTNATLVGIGAPTHIFLPDVAKALGTKCVIPENAGVANAIGAIVGSVSATATIEVRPNHTPGGIEDYTVLGTEKNTTVDELEEAVQIASEEAAAAAKAEARRRGVLGKVDIHVEVMNHSSTLKGNMTFDLGTTVTATASGKIA
ncbi:hydantoinase/oxoprolinase family protein [Christensenella tenuis]|uniref:Hydantoinase/oxoprolinase family protein n=1 Tax=Christensenella tenuis TaxID=2763033 RepID=A0ABR7EGV1_9FIRM|nr:hydantoinase/oxoprolinase family protein [Christensenella tenuis]MBC5648987.1 hydantoinase/oxoprolinase family protein [Christensenella tenuis]